MQCNLSLLHTYKRKHTQSHIQHTHTHTLHLACMGWKFVVYGVLCGTVSVLFASASSAFIVDYCVHAYNRIGGILCSIKISNEGKARECMSAVCRRAARTWRKSCIMRMKLGHFCIRNSCIRNTAVCCSNGNVGEVSACIVHTSKISNSSGSSKSTLFLLILPSSFI